MSEWQGAEYQDVSQLQRQLADESLAALVLDGTERVLDVGCGDGRITAAIAARVPSGSALGIDPSHDMIEFARRNHTAANLGFQLGDATTLAYRDAFDVVVSFNALHWVLEQETALRAIHAALHRGGRALLQMVSRGERPALEDVIEETCASAHWGPRFPGHRAPFQHWRPDEYRTLAERTGFGVERIEVVDRAWDFGSRAAFTRWAHATFVPWLTTLPAERYDAFIADVLDRYGTDVFAFYQMRAWLVA